MEAVENWSDDEEEDPDETEYLANEEEPHERSGHVAVKLDKYIVVFGGYLCIRQIFQGITFYREEYSSHRVIWMYNLDSERWKYVVTKGQDIPQGTSGSCGVVVGADVYMQGGHTHQGNTNALWKLTGSGGNGIEWKELKIGNEYRTPSPRDKHVAWEYEDKIWIFGGFGPPLAGFLNLYGEFIADGETVPLRGWNNQLLCYDISEHEWTNVRCNGSVPSPRAAHALTQVNDKVLLFGGRHGARRLDDLFELHMPTLTWTLLTTSGPEKPVGRSWHSFTYLSDSQIVLHGGYSTDRDTLSDTWLLQLPSLSWTRYTVDADHSRLWHSATTGNSGTVMIFGGCQSDILSPTDHPEMCNDIFLVSTEPKQLLKLALQSVYEHRAVLQSEWETLPRNLYTTLIDMCTYGKEDIVEEEKREGKVTCSIS